MRRLSLVRVIKTYFIGRKLIAHANVWWEKSEYIYSSASGHFHGVIKQETISEVMKFACHDVIIKGLFPKMIHKHAIKYFIIFKVDPYYVHRLFIDTFCCISFYTLHYVSPHKKEGGRKIT